MKGTLIGKQVIIKEAANKSLEGMSGMVVNETKNTITIKTRETEKMALKNQIKIEIEGKQIDGKQLMKRVEERLKR